MTTGAKTGVEVRRPAMVRRAALFKGFSRLGERRALEERREDGEKGDEDRDEHGGLPRMDTKEREGALEGR